MKKLFTLCCLTFIALLPIRGEALSPDNSEPYRVGVILALSGPGASFGLSVKRAVDLAYNALSASEQAKLKLIFEDDELLPAKSVSAFQKLTTFNQIDAAIIMTSTSGNAIAPLAEQKGIVTLDVGASDRKISDGRKFVFLHWVTPETEMLALAREIKKQGYKKIALITNEQPGFLALYNAMIPALNSAGLMERVVLDETFIPGDNNFQTYITKAKNRGADAVVVQLLPGGCAAFAKQARALGLKADFAGVELFEDESEVKAAEGALLEQWYVNADDGDAAFLENFKKTYGQEPGWGAANAYDSLKLLSMAVERKGHDNKAIAEFLRSLKDYSGAAGTYSATGDQRFELPAAIKIVTKDGFRKKEPLKH